MNDLSVVFDTEPLLSFYRGEPGDTEVELLLNQVIEGSVQAYINIVNLTELYYILHRYSPEAADEKTRNLRAYGIKVVPLVDDTITLGTVLRTRDGVKPVFVSVGHKVDLETAEQVVLDCAVRYRLPEPTRLADRLVAVAKQEMTMKGRKQTQ